MKSWPCIYQCANQVTELGAYVKLSTSRYAHLYCHNGAVKEDAIKVYLAEQALLKDAEAQRQKAEHDARLKEQFNDLPRCTRCGRKFIVEGLGVSIIEMRSLGDVQNASSTPNVCAACVREEIQARARARNVEPPASAAQAIQRAPTALPEAAKPEEKKDEPKADRFNLIEME